MDDSIEMHDVTFCIWRSRNDSTWSKGRVVVPEDYDDGDDGEYFLLGYIFENADSWLEWAKAYYEEAGERIQIDYVKKIYEHQTVTKEIVEMINLGRNFDLVDMELKKIGYTA